MSIYKIIFILVGVAFLLSNCKYDNNKITSSDFIENDSIRYWINSSKNKSLKINKRKDFLFKAYQGSSKLIDSIKNKNLLEIAFEAKKLNDTFLFLKVNKEASNLSIRIKDTFGVADTHWNYAAYLVKEEKLDSAYYHYHKAFLNFNLIKNKYYSGKMLYNMAFIQSRFRNYIESEILIFQAISKFKFLKKQRSLYQCYNLLGLIYNELEEYDKSIDYFNQSLEYLRKVKKRKTYKERSLNNISLVYERQGNHKKAIFYLKKALKNDSIKVTNINQYARLVDNLAYNKFLNGDTINLLHGFYKSLKIRESLHNKSGVAISKLHLAEYFAKYNDTLKAIDNAKHALFLSQDMKNNRDILSSLKLLSAIDIANTKTYLENYISLNGSLQKEERKTRNKFTRIDYETNEYIKETELLSKQKKWIIITSFFIISIISLLYYVKKQKLKNKELILEKEQQKANEEIYELILTQQSKKEEGRMQERNRISEDLHDGVLGKLFGARIAFGLLDIEGNEDTIKKYEAFLIEMQSIENDIRNISHKLKNEFLSSNHDFITLVSVLIEKQSKISNFKFKLLSDNLINWDVIDNNIKINIYHIIQEAIQNINKHANASLVEINFSLHKEMLNLVIKDNGIGFDIKNTKKGIGLKNIASRVQKLSGTFKVNSIIDNETIIKISAPM